MKLAILLSFFFQTIHSFLPSSRSIHPRFSFQLSMMSNVPIREVLKYKDYLPAKPLSKLYDDMEKHQVDSLYFSNDLKNVYSKNHYDKEIDDDEPISPMNEYSVTYSSPVITNQIIEFSNKNKVETTILVDPVNPYYDSLNNVLGLIGKVPASF
jgi:hypothetical protein